MGVYSVDVKMAGTAYIRADSPEEAKRIANETFGPDKPLGVYFDDEESSDIPVSGVKLDSPELPDVSLSPAMTINGWYSEFAVEDHEIDDEDEDDEDDQIDCPHGCGQEVHEDDEQCPNCGKYIQ